MSKRPRDGGGPKAAQDAHYNPYKRVLLSYASDEDEQDVQVNREHVKQLPANGQAVPSLANQQSASEHAGRAEAEDNAEDAEDAEGIEHEKSSAYGVRDPTNYNDDSLWSRKVRKNDATGQWAALGSLSYQWEDGGEDDQYDSEEAEAMSYLQAVR